MIISKNSPNINNNKQYDEIEYSIFCDALEKQYAQAEKDGLFKILKVFELDKEHSDSKLVQAIDYYNEKNGIVEKDAPIDLLTEHEKRMVNRDGKFRPNLYCMLLSTKLSEAIQNKSVFMKHSFKYSFDNDS